MRKMNQSPQSTQSGLSKEIGKKTGYAYIVRPKIEDSICKNAPAHRGARKFNKVANVPARHPAATISIKRNQCGAESNGGIFGGRPFNSSLSPFQVQPGNPGSNSSLSLRYDRSILWIRRARVCLLLEEVGRREPIHPSPRFDRSLQGLQEWVVDGVVCVLLILEIKK